MAAVACGVCMKVCKSMHGVIVHMGRMHRENTAALMAAKKQAKKGDSRKVKRNTTGKVVKRGRRPAVAAKKAKRGRPAKGRRTATAVAAKKAATTTKKRQKQHQQQQKQQNAHHPAAAADEEMPDNVMMADDDHVQQQQQEQEQEIMVLGDVPADNEEAEIVVLKTTKKAPNAGVLAASVMNAAYPSWSNSVSFDKVDLVRGTIDQINFKFLCDNCRGTYSLTRCYRGRAHCVMCCGHSGCA